MAKTRSQVKSDKNNSIQSKQIEKSSTKKRENSGSTFKHFSIICERLNESQRSKNVSLSSSNEKKIIIRNINLKINAGGLQIDNDLKLKSAKNQFNMTISVKEDGITISSNDTQQNQHKNISNQITANGHPKNISNEQEHNQIVSRFTRSQHQLIEKPKEISSQIVKQTKTVLSKFMVPTLNSLIDSSWRQSKSIQQQLNVQMIVMAKMKTYSPWPARILELNHAKKRAKVYFFGSNNEGFVDQKEIVEFDKATQTIRLLLIRCNSTFLKAVKEVEKILKVPDNLSLFKKTDAIES